MNVNLELFRTLKFCSAANCHGKHHLKYSLTSLDFAQLCLIDEFVISLPLMNLLFFTMMVPQQTNKSIILISACSVCHIWKQRGSRRSESLFTGAKMTWLYWLKHSYIKTRIPAQIKNLDKFTIALICEIASLFRKLSTDQFWNFWKFW